VTVRPDAYTFVLRLWIEEEELDPPPHQWRGHITNVLDGRRCWVQDLGQVERFVTEYLDPTHHPPREDPP
jgi:hypothetical protein